MVKKKEFQNVYYEKIPNSKLENMEIDFSIKFEFLKKFDFSDESSKDNHYAIISLDNYFNCTPVKVSLREENEWKRVVLTYEQNEFFNQKMMNKIIQSNFRKYIKGGYRDTKMIPNNSTLIIKVFTEQLNTIKQKCQVIKCGSLFQLKALSKYRNMKSELYIHQFKFGTVKIRLNNMNNNNYKWITINSLITGDPYLFKNPLEDHLIIARNYQKKVAKFMNKLSYPIALSNRIKCDYYFSIYGLLIPLGFVYTPKYKSNLIFWENLYLTCMLDVVLRFQLATYSELENITIYDFARDYWKKLDLEKKMILAILMLRKIPNSIVYVTDYVLFKRGFKTSENFNPCCFYNKSADCEDFSFAIRILFNAFLQNSDKIKNSKLKGLTWIWHFFKCHIDVVTLDRVTEAEIKGNVDKGEKGIAAHMNVVLIFIKYLFENLNVIEKYKNSSDYKQYLINKSKVLNILDYHIDAMMRSDDILYKNKKEYEREKKNFIQKLRLLVVEGTGILCPIKMHPPNEYEYEYVKNLFKNLRKTLMHVYHIPEMENQFFTHMHLGFADFPNRFNINVDGFIFTRNYKKGKNVKPIYGTRYEEVIENKNTSFIMKPFLNNDEIESANYVSRLQLKIPVLKLNIKYKLKKTNLKKKITISSKENTNTNKEEDDNVGIKNAKLMYYINKHKVFNHIIDKNQTRSIAQLNRRLLIEKNCNKLKEYLRINLNRNPGENFKNVVIFYKFTDFCTDWEKISNTIINAVGIKGFDYYFEYLFDNIFNVALVLKIVKN